MDVDQLIAFDRIVRLARQKQLSVVGSEFIAELHAVAARSNVLSEATISKYENRPRPHAIRRAKALGLQYEARLRGLTNKPRPRRRPSYR